MMNLINQDTLKEVESKKGLNITLQKHGKTLFAK